MTSVDDGEERRGLERSRGRERYGKLKSIKDECVVLRVRGGMLRGKMRYGLCEK